MGYAHGIPAIESIGERFGRLKVLKIVYKPHSRIPYAYCKCKCGNFATICLYSLRGKLTKSCGCLKHEVAISIHTTHGESSIDKTPEYRAWAQFNQRCRNPKNPKFKAYGGRGIKVFWRWKYSYKAFLDYLLETIGRRPKKGKWSLDRINNDGDYTPGNIRWATSEEQANNRRKRKKKVKIL